MHSILDYLEEIKLNSSETLEEYLRQCSTEDLYNLIIYLGQLIENDYVIQKYTPFTYVATDDISGVGGCDEIHCKIQRAQHFSIFSALYADNVYIQLDLITDPHLEMNDPEEIDNNKDLKEYFYYHFQCDIEIINTYTELIKADIVHITPPKKMYCKNCFQKAVLGIDYHIPIDALKEEYSDRINLIVSSYNEDTNTLLISPQNMDEFFPDHNIVFPLNTAELQLVPITERKDGKIIKSKELKRSFINNFIDDEFFNACYYASYCNQQNAKLITNKISDSLFLSLTKNDNNLKTLERKSNCLPQYDMPYITDISLKDIIKLRELEHESFNKYRISLNTSVQEQLKTNSAVNWQQIYDDILYPAYNDLDLKLHQIKNGVFKRTFATMGIFTTVILAGQYVGIIPENINTLFASIGTTLTTNGANYLLDKSSTKKSDLLNNDYYFLWKLKNKAKK